MDDNPYQAPQSRIDPTPRNAGDEDDDEIAIVPHHEYDPTGLLFAETARRSGLAIDALRFVFDAKANAWDFVEETPEGRLRGPRLCVAVVRYAEELFGAEAFQALHDWGLVSGRDVGRVVEALEQNGLWEASNGDEHEDFGSVGPLRELRLAK